MTKRNTPFRWPFAWPRPRRVPVLVPWQPTRAPQPDDAELLEEIERLVIGKRDEWQPGDRREAGAGQ